MVLASSSLMPFLGRFAVGLGLVGVLTVLRQLPVASSDAATAGSAAAGNREQLTVGFLPVT